MEADSYLQTDVLQEGEWRIPAELALPVVDGKAAAVPELADIIDAPALQTMMDEFFRLTQIGVGIFDLQGRVLVATGWQNICTQFHRVHPCTRRNCVDNNLQLFQDVQPGTFKLYRCKNHLYEIATPIVVGDQKAGYLSLGQFLFGDEPPPDREVFRTQARQCGFDEQDYLAALDQVPLWSRETVVTAIRFYVQFAHLFSTLGCRNLQLAQSIAEQQQIEADLRRSEAQYRAVIETCQDGFWIADFEGRLLEANEAYARLSGYSRDELRTLTIADLDAREHPEEIALHINKILRNGSDLFQTWHRAKNGRMWQAEVNVSCWPIAGGRFFVFIRDMHRRQRSEMLLKARLQLAEMAANASLDDLLRAALDLAEQFTGSLISFFHFVDSDQEHLTLQAWSTNTLKTSCAITSRSEHYPLSEAGVWADCLRQRRALFHNDYASLPYRRGLPEGHAPVIRQLTAPIFRQGQIVAIIGIGNKPEDYTDDDLEAVQQLADLLMDVVERKQTEQRIEQIAYYDALTMLPNRVLLIDRLQQAIAQRGDRRLAVCCLDLDDFKQINGVVGRAQGDRLLVTLAHRLKSCLRTGDTVARLWGDEFALLLNSLNAVEECENTLERVLTTLQTPVILGGKLLSVTASLGVTLFPDDHSDADTLLRHADQAMYAAKQAGGNRYHWFDADYHRRARSHRTILQRVQAGLKAGEFRLHYQPKVNMRQGAVQGAEALIRWQHPEEGLLAPARFMPAVESSELSVVVDLWVLNEALQQMAVWVQQSIRLPVSVNLSGRCLQQPDFVDQLRALLHDYPTVPAGWLTLEILETAALEDIKTVSALIADCQRLGVRFALDDFGTGYSSLTYLKHLPVDLLKIDQSFVRDMLTDSEARAIVEGVIGLSRVFRRNVIAEGVETEAHGRLLLYLGCELAQGYGIARPMPPDHLPAWITDWKPPVGWIGVATVTG